jgi:multidrug efflux pump subunit AcrA (membrane-fusion protein)
MKKRRISILAVAVLIMAIVVSAFFLRRSKVELVDVKRGNIQESVYGLGKVRSRKIYDLKLGVPDRIISLFVKEGDIVKKGDRLAKFEEGPVATAPFEGTITALQFHESENVFPQAVVMRIEDLNDIYIEVTLEQQGALRVRAGHPAKFSLESLRGTLGTGIVESIFPKEDQFVVRVTAQNFPKEILPGMTADVAIEVGHKDNVLLIPLGAVNNGRVVVVRGGHKIKVDVKVGAVDGDWAEVLDGDVKTGDQVVVPKG